MQGDSATSDTTSASGDTSVADTTTVAETIASDEDEVGSHNFNGEEFHAYTFSHISYHGDLTVESETGDVLNDAIYDRNRALEERFNFDFVETKNETTDAARTAVLANDDTYDIINARCTNSFDYAAEGLLIPITELSAIDLTKDYWDQGMTDTLSIMGRNYFAMGDYNLSSYDYIHTMLFNKQMAKSHGISDLYATVRDGNWTFDEYVATAKTVVSDVNGDGQMTIDDRFGYLASFKQVLPNFWIAADELSMEKDSDDKLVFTMPGDENFFNVFTKIFEMNWDEGVWLMLPTTHDMPEDIIKSFQNDLSLFLDCTFFRVNSMRSMDADFGIIPYPKYDEAQDDYHSRLEYCVLTCVPVTNPNKEMTGVILETLACESHKTVVPAYYDISLQTKMTRDEDSVEMLDIIFDSRVVDWGDTMLSPQIRDGMIKDMFRDNNRDLSSKIATLEATVQARIDTITAAFEKIG